MRRLLRIGMLAILWATPASAQNYTWTGNTSTDWYGSGNWSPGVPQPGGTVLFSQSAQRFTIDLFGLTANGIDTIRFDGAGLGSFTMQNGNLGLQGNNLIEVTSIVPTNQTINMNVNLSGAGTFRNNGGGTLSFGGTVTMPGQLTFDGNGAITVGGTLTGAGSLLKTGNGTLTITGSGNHTGGTTISGGTLQIGNGGTTGGIPGNITNNASLAFNRSNNFAYSGQISGSGSVTKSGGGTLALGNNNSYTGPTVISGGVLEAINLNNGGVNTSIGSSSNAAGNLIFNGGTLRYTGPGSSINRNFTLGTGGGTIDSGLNHIDFFGPLPLPSPIPARPAP